MALFGSGGRAIFGEKKRLGEQLIDEGLITAEQLEMALSQQKDTGKKLGETLMAMGFMSAQSFSTFFEEAYGILITEAESIFLTETRLDDKCRVFGVWCWVIGYCRAGFYILRQLLFWQLGNGISIEGTPSDR